MEKYDGDITRMLHAMKDGDERARDMLWELVFEKLHSIASQRMRRERDSHTLSTTGLVHEAYFKLARHPIERLEDRNQFFAFASHVMRQVLIDYARTKNAQKNNCGVRPEPLEHAALALDETATFDLAWIIDLHNALDELEAIHPRWAQVAIFRYYGDMKFKEIGEAIGKNQRTAERDWQHARKWLFARLNDDGPEPTGIAA